jgi:hypothetical protein
MGRPKGSKNKVQRVNKAVAKFPPNMISKYRMHPFLGQTPEVREELLAKELVKTKGLYSRAARNLQIDQATVSRMVKASDYLALVIVEIKERLKDDIENKFYDNMLNTKNENTFLAYFEKFTKNSEMKSRGWNEEPTIQINQVTYQFGSTQNNEIDVEFIAPDNQD